MVYSAVVKTSSEDWKNKRKGPNGAVLGGVERNRS